MKFRIWPPTPRYRSMNFADSLAGDPLAASQSAKLVRRGECVSVEILEELLTEGLTASEADEVRRHLGDCPRCRTALDELSEHPALREWRSGCADLASAPLPQAELEGLLENLRERPPLRDATIALDESSAGACAFFGPPEQEGDLGTLGSFRILSELGHGGMGIVFRAYDKELARTVAIKVLRWERTDENARARFVREAQAAARLEHDNVVAMYGVMSPLDGPPYLVMQYIAGRTLRDQIVAQGQLDPREAAQIAVQVADGLTAAHRAGLIHRDIKPANIMLDSTSGRARIMDFGLVRAQQEAQGVTLEGTIPGTPEYMSPEQIREPQQIDERSDIYSLGVTLYEALTGEVPFRGVSTMVLQQVLQDEPVSPRRLSDRIPRDLETICLKCLDKQPSRRYASAQALAEDLHRQLAGKSIAARPTGRVERLVRWCRRNRLEAVLIASVALALLVGTCVSTYFALEAIGRQQAEINAAVAEVEARDARAANELFQRHLYLTKMLVAQTAWEEVRLQDLSDLLEAVRPEHTSGTDHRRFEWYYWQRASHTDLMTVRSDGPAYCVRFSPDGQRMAFAGEKGKGWVVDRTSGKQLCELTGHDGPIWSIAFTSDGRRLATASDDRTVRIWNAETGEQLAVLEAHTSDVTAVAFSPDGFRLASAGEDRTVRVWDWHESVEVVTYKGHMGAVWNVGFGSDGKRIVSCGDDGAHLWRADSGETIKILRGHEGPVYCADITADGTRVATASEDQSVRIWHLAADEPVMVLSGHTRGVRSVQFSPDGGRLVSAGRDGAVRLWDTNTGRSLFVLGHTYMVDSAVFNPDGRLVAAADRAGEIKVWDATRERQPTTFRDHDGIVEAAAFSPDGHWIASAGRDGNVLVRDAESGRAVFKRTDHAGFKGGVAFHPQGRLLAVARSNHTVRIYDVEADRQVHELHGHTAAVHAVAFNADGRLLASAGNDGVIHLWDPLNGKLLSRLPHVSAEVNSVAFSPDGRWLVAARSDHLATVWDVKERRVRLTLRGHTGPVYSAAFSHDGTRLATGAQDMTARVWDASDGRMLFALKGHKYSLVSSVAFSPDGSRLASASGGLDKRIKLWDLTTGQEVLTLKGHTDGVESVAFSADGHRLVSASTDGTVKVWDARPIDPATAR
jgi:WD40 repeat protein/tRNA A-37 threonylcarbamoyl transferase component Bud32